MLCTVLIYQTSRPQRTPTNVGDRSVPACTTVFVVIFTLQPTSAKRWQFRSSKLATNPLPLVHMALWNRTHVPVHWALGHLGTAPAPRRRIDTSKPTPEVLRAKVTVFVVLFTKTAMVKQYAEASDRLNTELEQRVAERTAVLQRSNEELQQFAHLVSHDLVVVFTTSAQSHDIDMCYQPGAKSYIAKPVDFERLRYILELLMRYWFSVVTLPERRSP